MALIDLLGVAPAQAGDQGGFWIPAFAGMTFLESR
jgi:hypothetical protein